MKNSFLLSFIIIIVVTIIISVMSSGSNLDYSLYGINSEDIFVSPARFYLALTK